MAKITDDQQDEMFQLWCILKPKYGYEKAFDEIAKRCKVCVRTVRKYHKANEWDKQLDDIQLQTRAKGNHDIVEERRKNLKIIRAAKTVYITQLKSDTLKGKVKLNDIAELIKTEMLITGDDGKNSDSSSTDPKTIQNRILSKYQNEVENEPNK